MKLVLGWAVGCLAVLLGSGQVSAQHLHQHGNHFDVHQNVPHGHDHAGHMVDNWGHHIDGHGQHTGAIGVYDNGAASFHAPHYGGYSGYPGYSSYGGYNSSYYGSGLYGSSLYGYGMGYSGLGLSIGIAPAIRSQVIVPNTGYQAFGNQIQGVPAVNSIPTILGTSRVLTAPQAGGVVANSVRAPAVGNNVVANKIPTRGAGPGSLATANTGEKIVLRNPSSSGGSIHYSLNQFQYEIKPGESQTIDQDRKWVLKFDNGLGQTVERTLEPGKFQFQVSPETGWELSQAPLTSVQP